jgi:hypothetical protein
MRKNKLGNFSCLKRLVLLIDASNFSLTVERLPYPVIVKVCGQRQSLQLKDQGCDNVLHDQGYPTPQETVAGKNEATLLQNY